MLWPFWKRRSVKKQRTPCIAKRRAFSMPIGIPRRRTPVRIPSLPRLNVCPRFPLSAPKPVPTRGRGDHMSEWMLLPVFFFFLFHGILSCCRRRSSTSLRVLHSVFLYSHPRRRCRRHPPPSPSGLALFITPYRPLFFLAPQRSPIPPFALGEVTFDDVPSDARMYDRTDD